MGIKRSNEKDNSADPNKGSVSKPLRLLKRELLQKLNLNEDHFFAVFVKYRYWNSYRNSLQNLEMLRLEFETME